MTDLVRFTPPVMEDGSRVTEFSKTILRYADGRKLSDSEYIELYHSYLNDGIEAGYLKVSSSDTTKMYATEEVKKLPYDVAQQILTTGFPAPLNPEYAPGSYGYQEYVEKIVPIVQRLLVDSSLTTGLVATKTARLENTPGIVSLVGIPVTLGGFIPVAIFGMSELWTAFPAALGVISGVGSLISGVYWLGAKTNKEVNRMEITEKGKLLLEEVDQYERAFTAGGNYVTAYEHTSEKPPRLPLLRRK